MEAITAKKLIKKLTNEINEHNYKYYCLSQPSISDYEFDKLLKQLKELEEKFPAYKLKGSPTENVASDITDSFKKAAHIFPMLSLSNTYSKEEIIQFEKKIKSILGSDKQIEYVCELKFDGVSINLVYKNGILIQAITRGDGTEGEDVTANIKTIYSIPKTIKTTESFPDLFEVRGEIFIHTQSFVKINEKRKKENLNLFANPRNLASGSIKLLDINEVRKRPLDIFCYSMYCKKALVLTHYERLLKLKSWGFNVSKHIKLCHGINEVMEFITMYDSYRKYLSFDIDGIVIKVNDIKLQDQLGATAKSPRWAVAYKYDTKNIETQILDISFQVGRTGIITPVALLKPTLLNGTIVKRASLHNAAELNRLDIRTNDTVYVEKSGEIIPKVTGVNLDKREKTSKKYSFITICPACGTPLLLSESQAYYYCPNIYGCKPQILAKIEHFASKGAMGIEGLSIESIKLFYDKKLITSIPDIYKLKEKTMQLQELKGWGVKSINNILQAIEDSKNKNLHNLIYALGLPGVGKTMAINLATFFKDLHALSNASISDLLTVPGIGEILSTDIKKFFKQELTKSLINKLIEEGLNIQETSEHKSISSNKLYNKTFVISGIFDNFTRNDITKLLSSNGAKVITSISKNANYLLTGRSPSKTKIEKANNLNVKIISFDDLNMLLNE